MNQLKLKALPQALLTALLVTPLAYAQQAPVTQKIEKIEVTGSNIKRVDDEGTTPITVLKREDIEKSGYTTVTDLLRSLPSTSTPGFGTASDLTGSNSFSGGASAINLRGLGGSATLVLLNGRRIAPFGLANPNFGQTTFVNIDSLPLAVVERIEVLRDGASAIYGSDAVAGVVNIITRKDFTGALARAGIAMNRDSEYKTQSASGTIGYGDLAKDRFNVFLNVESLKRDMTILRDVDKFLNRDILRTAFSTGVASSSYAYNYYRPTSINSVTGLVRTSTFIANSGTCATNPDTFVDSAGRCIYDQTFRAVISPETKRNTVFARGTLDISATTTLFGEFSWNNNKTYYVGNPQAYGDGNVQYFAAKTASLVSPPEILPVGHPSNPYTFPVILRARMFELGLTGTKLDSTATRAVAGIKTTLGNWDVESAISDSRNDNKAYRLNQLRLSAMREAILNNGYNFLNPTAGRLKPNDLKIDTLDKGKSSSTGIDARASSELMQLPAGPLALAAGVEYRRESFTQTPDANIIAGEVIGNGASAADGSRNAFSVYAELSVPVLKSLELQIAGRSDKFSDYGRSNTPKIGLLWKALPSLRFRANYAEGFRAPSLTEASKSSVSAFQNGYIDPTRCPASRPLIDDCRLGYSVASFIEATPNLQPETSKSHTVGFAWEPVKDLLTSVDFWQIKRKNEIVILSLADIVANEGGNNPLYQNRLVRDIPDPDGRPGRILSVKRGYLNDGRTNIQGFDVDLSYPFNLGAVGKLTVGASGTYLINYLSAGNEGAYTDFSGTRAIPRVRASATATWEYRDIALTSILRYTGRTAAVQNSTAPCTTLATPPANTTICEVGDLLTIDISGRWKATKDLTLRAGMQNITNRQPPLSPLVRPVDSLLYSTAIAGTYYSMNAEYRFK